MFFCCCLDLNIGEPLTGSSAQTSGKEAQIDDELDTELNLGLSSM